MLRILARVIPEMGHQVETAASIKAALAAAERESFDLLISDLRLPDGDGRDLLRKLPVQRAIALSGSGRDEDVRRSLEAGFIEHLTKPVDLETLEAAIQRVAEMDLGSPSDQRSGAPI